MRIGLLVDGLSITRWQAESLRRIGDDVELIVYNCTNAPPSPRRLRHYPYYLLNLVSLRTALTRQGAFSKDLRFSERIDFECRREGHWQSLPDALIERINADRVEAIVKFGLGLLRVPDGLAVPILSYHHGDPRRYRGRPAGFYEMLNDEPVVGQVIQILSNELDAGQAVAFAETPVHRHSYRATMREAYSVSPLLLSEALKSVGDRGPLNIVAGGRVTRLPSGWTVLRFAAQRLAAKLRRLAYGAFMEKEWRVAQAPLRFQEPPFLGQFPPQPDWQVVVIPEGFRFLADPFPHPTGEGILAEALRSSTGLGEILQIGPGGCRTLLGGPGHHSYPATVTAREGCFLVPEICQWSAPTLFSLDGAGARPLGPLRMPGPIRLVDPTLFEHQGTIFLFANDYSEGDFVLRLWWAETIMDVFHEHPASPLLISPRGGRMGGLVIRQHGLYRVGQDSSGGYGSGIRLFRISELDRGAYRETMVDELSFAGVHGPHTLNFAGGNVLFDFYRHRFAPLAGFRRLRNRLASRQSSQAPSSP